ncbi:hypothetical protein HZB96_00560 [Candidatus Gottesmanbacteria bacterium]|nr:hypothetical protein [Candidatus Gottesmanbacteria bacterium]
MTNIKESLRLAKTAVKKGAETVFTGLFCSAVVLYPGKSRVDKPDVLHTGDGYTEPTPLDGGVVYYPPGITAQTAIDGGLAVVRDFSNGRKHNGRAEIVYLGKSIPLNRPDVQVPIGKNGARGMYTKKNPAEITEADLAG